MRTFTTCIQLIIIDIPNDAVWAQYSVPTVVVLHQRLREDLPF